ncbi:hypothetical protein LguiB_033733 [Lonicera macranthoides]
MGAKRVLHLGGILVDGCGPFSEDLWKEIRINRIKFQSAQLCYRRKVYFGQNLVCNDLLSKGKGNIIEVGDPIYANKHVNCRPVLENSNINSLD